MLTSSHLQSMQAPVTCAIRGCRCTSWARLCEFHRLAIPRPLWAELSRAYTAGDVPLMAALVEAVIRRVQAFIDYREGN